MRTASPNFKPAPGLRGRHLSRICLGVAVALLGGSLALGCGSQTRPTTSDHVSESGVPGEPVFISDRAWEGFLQAQGGVVSLTVTSGDVQGSACVRVAHADLAPAPGEEALWRCADTLEPTDTAALALTSGNTLLWTTQDFVIGDCIPTDLVVLVVDALPGAPRELLVRVVGCDFTGDEADYDAFLPWGPSGMQCVAEASMGCTYTGDTSEPGTHTVTLTDVAPQTGTYTVRANSNTANETGDYTLRITAGPAPTGQLP